MKSNRRTMFAFLVLLCGLGVSGLAAEPSPAEEMLGMLPQDTFFSIATSGTDSLAPAFKQSSLGVMWNDPGVQKFVAQIKEPLLKAIKAESNDAVALQDIQGLIEFLASCPIAAGVSLKTDAQGESSFYGCVLIKAGDKKDAIAAELAKAEALAGEGQIVSKRIARTEMRGPKVQDEEPVYWGWHRDIFVVLINDERGWTIRNLRRRSLQSARSKPIPGNLKDHGDIFIVNCDVEKVIQTILAELETTESPDVSAKIKGALDALGVSGIRTVSARAGFDGPDLVVDSLMGLAGPPEGLLAAARQIDISAFDKVQTGAAHTSAWNVDIAGLYDMILKVIESEGGREAAQAVRSPIAAAEQLTGIKIRDGLVESLAGPMVIYNVPAFQVAQAPSGGWVLIAELNDAALFEKNAGALGAFAATKAEGMLQIGSQQTPDGHTLNNWIIAPLAIMQIMPCWTVTDKDLIIATNPQLATMALKQLAQEDRKASSIRSQDDFKEIEANLPKGVFFVQYDDSQTQLRQLHRQLQQFWPMLNMAAANSGFNLPPMLPQIEHVIKDLHASVEYGWIDDNGIRGHYQGCGIQHTGMGVGGGAMGLAILMPALSKTKHIAQRTVSASNLKGLGLACRIHANDEDDKFPPTLETLVETADVSPKSLVSPRKPDDFDGPSYIYIPGQTTSSPPTNVLAYENPAFLVEKINVLYVDGHVAAVSPEELEEQLTETRKQVKENKAI